MPVRALTEALPAAWTRGEISVIGLGRSGRAATELLCRAGAHVYASDSAPNDSLSGARAELQRFGAVVEGGSHDLSRIARSALVVASPGIPPDAPPLQAAKKAGVAIVGELEVALHFLPHQRYIAITGTNGKTTTTAMTHALLDGLGFKSVAAGNIGTPLAEIALRVVPPDWIALETSSFQLHDTPSLSPSAGILTNLSANHLDRYAGVGDYFADKAQLFRNANGHSLWVTNADDAEVQRLSSGVRGRHLHFSLADRRADGWYDRAADVLMVMGEPLVARGDLVLLGDHNVANALAAALSVMGVDEAYRTPDSRLRIGAALREFHALEHRIELVGRRSGVDWINDSKSTNVASTLVALAGMHRSTILLLGGRHKGEPYTALADELRRTVKLVLAYGEAAPLIERDLEGTTSVERVDGTFADVVERAHRAAVEGDAVLLSPACSSYDMFDNYERRGQTFKQLVGALGDRP